MTNELDDIEWLLHAHPGITIGQAATLIRAHVEQSSHAAKAEQRGGGRAGATDDADERGPVAVVERRSRRADDTWGKWSMRHVFDTKEQARQFILGHKWGAEEQARVAVYMRIADTAPGAPSKSPAPDGDGGEEDGAERMFTESRAAVGLIYPNLPRYTWEDLLEKERALFRCVYAWHKKESAEALSQIRAALCNLADVETDTGETTLEVVELIARDRRHAGEALGRAEEKARLWSDRCMSAGREVAEANDRAAKAEARLAAWEPVVRAAIADVSLAACSLDEADACSQALERAVDALPAEHRPDEAEARTREGR